MEATGGTCSLMNPPRRMSSKTCPAMVAKKPTTTPPPGLVRSKALGNSGSLPKAAKGTLSFVCMLSVFGCLLDGSVLQFGHIWAWLRYLMIPEGITPQQLTYTYAIPPITTATYNYEFDNDCQW